jgi:hypothetical protein
MCVDSSQMCSPSLDEWWTYQRGVTPVIIWLVIERPQTCCDGQRLYFGHDVVGVSCFTLECLHMKKMIWGNVSVNVVIKSSDTTYCVDSGFGVVPSLLLIHKNSMDKPSAEVFCFGLHRSGNIVWHRPIKPCDLEWQTSWNIALPLNVSQAARVQQIT